MKRAKQRYDRAFKIPLVAELESGKLTSQIAREHSIHPSISSGGGTSLQKILKKAFNRNGNKYKDQAKIRDHS